MQHPDEGTIHAWLDGALPPAEASALEAHVASCAECSAAVAEARGMLAAASRILSALDDVPGGVIPAPAPADATRVAPGRASAAEVRPFRFRAARWQVAAGLMIAVAGSWLVMRNDGARDMVEIKAADTSVAEQASVAFSPDTLAGMTERVAESAPVAKASAPRAGRPGSRTEVASSVSIGSAFGTGAGGKAAVGGAASGSTTTLMGDVSGVLRGTDVSRDVPAANKVAAEETLAQVQTTTAAASPLDSALDADSVATALQVLRGRVAMREERMRAIEPAQRRQVAPAPAAPPVESRGATADAAPQLLQSRLPESTRNALGCYDVSVGRWSAAVDSTSAALVPRWLQLTDEAAPTGDAWIVRAVPGMPPFPDGVSASWTALGPDQIRVRVNAGGRIAVMTLAVSLDALRGRLRVTASDGTTPSAEVTARRATCPAPQPSR